MQRYAILMLALAGGCMAERRPFAPEDLWAWRGVSGPQISPDGRWVAYTEAENDRAAGVRRQRLRLVSWDGKQKPEIAQGDWDDSNARWSSDSTKLAWITARSGKPQIRVRLIETGREFEVPTQNAPLDFSWSPDAERVAFTAQVAVSEPAPAWAPPEIVPRLLHPAPQTRVALFVANVSGGGVRLISKGNFDYTGTPAWLPTAQAVAAARSDGGIYMVRIPDGQEKRLTPAGSRNENPIAAESGKIAWLATSDVPGSYAVRTLWVMNSDGSRAKALSGSLDRDATAPAWSSDSRTVYFLADDQGFTHIYAARNDGTVRQLTSARERLHGFSLADNGRAATVRANATGAEELITLTVDRAAEALLAAAPNRAMVAERETGAGEEIRFASGTWTVQGWLLKPPGFVPATKHPLLLDIRDDPREMCGGEFNLERQILAARGFLVLCVNPRGTPGFGEIFGNLLPSRYPGDDFEDLMRAVDAVLPKYADPKRLYIMGGLLAAWGIGHTDRFAGAVARHPIVDWTSEVALAPDGERRARSMGAMPWDDPDQYVKHSPIFFAKNFKTPTLIIGDDGDRQSDELCFALKERNVPVEMARIPRQSTPGQQVLELQTILAWLTR